MQTRVYKTVKGHEIVAEIYLLSPAKDGQTYPAVLFIHGGGLVMGHRMMIDPGHIRVFHEGGYPVVSIDYRLAPETKLPEIVEDIQDAWHWLRGEADGMGIDRDRIAIAGHSAGAFLTLMSGYRLDPRPAALVSMASYGNLTHDEFTKPSLFYVQEHALADESNAREPVGVGTISSRFKRFDARLHWPRSLLSLLPPTRHLVGRSEWTRSRRSRLVRTVRAGLQCISALPANHLAAWRSLYRCAV